MLFGCPTFDPPLPASTGEAKDPHVGAQCIAQGRLDLAGLPVALLGVKRGIAHQAELQLRLHGKPQGRNHTRETIVKKTWPFSADVLATSAPGAAKKSPFQSLFMWDSTPHSGFGGGEKDRCPNRGFRPLVSGFSIFLSRDPPRKIPLSLRTLLFVRPHSERRMVAEVGQGNLGARGPRRLLEGLDPRGQPVTGVKASLN